MRHRAVCLALLVILSSACSAAPAPPSPSLVRIGWNDVGVPTPFRVSTAGPGGPVLLSLLYDTLTWKDEHGIIPWLATDWTVSPDGLDYTFHLAPNVRWQDGQPLDAQDVAFSFNYYARHPFRWAATDMVDTASAVDASTVTLRLNYPYAPFLEEVAGAVPIIPAHVWQTVADPLTYDAPEATLGSGPYRLAEYRSATGAYRLLANASYFKGRPLVDEVQQLNTPVETRVQAVLQGQLDLAQSADASVNDLLTSPRVKVLATAPLSVVRIVLNTSRPPLDKLEVRRAIALAVDRSSLAQTMTRDAPIVGRDGVIPPETPWFAPDTHQSTYDPDAARRELHGQPVTFDLLANPEYREPEVIAPTLAAVGITLRVRRVDAQTKAALLRSADFQAAELQHIGIGSDPDFLRRWYSAREANDSAQGDILDDARLSALAEQQARSVDPVARRALVSHMQSLLAEDLPTIPLYYRRFYWIYDSSRFNPMNTSGGLMNGIPFVHNKLAFLPR